MGPGNDTISIVECFTMLCCYGVNSMYGSIRKDWLIDLMNCLTWMFFFQNHREQTVGHILIELATSERGAFERYNPIILDLLRFGARFDYVDRHGDSMLHFAIKKGLMKRERLLWVLPCCNCVIEFTQERNSSCIGLLSKERQNERATYHKSDKSKTVSKERQEYCQFEMKFVSSD